MIILLKMVEIYFFRLPELIFAIRRCIDLRYPNKLLTQFIWRLLRPCYALPRNDDISFRLPENNYLIYFSNNFSKYISTFLFDFNCINSSARGKKVLLSIKISKLPK
ncbi:MAG: hypothetical protein IKX14_07265 [Neisseriaceae bacterium]|nr:hypothetical protein [Neisseriaceae bacterium]